MTPPRSKIESSLAQRGRPAMWANEQEAAVLSGYSLEGFRQAVSGLERIGFPMKNRFNGQRFIPAIENFWACQEGQGILLAPEEPEGPDGQEVENFGGSKRRTS